MSLFKKIVPWALSAALVSGIVYGAEIGDLSTTDSSNTARFPEGLLAGQTNDNLRALEGLLARGLKDTVDGVLTSTGTTTALNVTSNRTGTTSLYTGLSVRLLAHTTIGDAPTFTFNSVSAARVTWPNGRALASGDIGQYDVAELTFADGKWRVQSGGRAGTLQRSYAVFSTVSDIIGGAIPRDDTPPLSTEGVELLTTTLAPSASTNDVRIRAEINYDQTSAGDFVCALFQDSEATAMAAAGNTSEDGYTQVLSFQYITGALSTASRTYKLRCGSSAGAASINSGLGGSITMAGRRDTYLEAEEVPP